MRVDPAVGDTAPLLCTVNGVVRTVNPVVLSYTAPGYVVLRYSVSGQLDFLTIMMFPGPFPNPQDGLVAYWPLGYVSVVNGAFKIVQINYGVPAIVFTKGCQ